MSSTLLKLITFAALYIFVPSIIYAIVFFFWNSFTGREIPEQVVGFVIDLTTLLTVIFLFRLYKRKHFHDLFSGHVSVRKLLSLIPLSLLARVPLIIFVVILILVFGDTITTTMDEGLEFQWEGVDRSTNVNYIMSVLSFVVIGPIHEELFFRGVVYQYLKKIYSVRGSILISSVFFAIMHFHPGLYPSSFILGLFLAYIYHRWNNLIYAILLHMLINLHPFLLDAITGTS